jgi:hypothetical protein
MEAGKNSVIYMGLISGPNTADDTCGRTTVTGTMDRAFTVHIIITNSMEQSPGLTLAEILVLSLMFSQALFMSSLTFKFSKAANLFQIFI